MRLLVQGHGVRCWDVPVAMTDTRPRSEGKHVNDVVARFVIVATPKALVAA